MRALARFAMRGPGSAAGLVAAFAILGLVLPPCLFISGALVALATLSQGMREGLKVVALGGLIATAGLYALLNQVAPVAGYFATVWAPMWVIAGVLRRTRAQGPAVLMCGAVVAVYAVLFRALTGDVGDWWRVRIEAFTQTLAVQGGGGLDPEQLSLVAQMMHSVSLVVFGLFLIIMLLLGRWWQALLYNPGGFRAEFQTLALPRTVAGLAAAVAVIALVQFANGVRSGVGADLLIILVVLFAMQGLAVVHHRVNQLALPGYWLPGLYVLLLFVPHFVGTGLAVIGIGDAFADFRGCRRDAPRSP